jgi:3',5'-cyclic-AMP phosphodiesterase
MPIHLPPISRRSFLAQTAAAAGWLTFRTAWADETKADPNTFALLADTHIPASPETMARGVNMSDNLRQVVAELTALDPQPAAVAINGDCAYLQGLPSDYENLAQLVKPLAAAGLPLHLTMGNHDDRGPFYDALSNQRQSEPPVESKHVAVIESPLANWFLLDSLFEVNVVTGELGEKQLTWLAQALDARPDKPAIIFAHHNPQFAPRETGTAWTGLKDTERLFDLLADRKHVKAYVFGHTHTWNLSEVNGIHLINLPPVAYVFGEGRPNGWVQATARENGLKLKLHTIDKDHPQHHETAELKWR